MSAIKLGVNRSFGEFMFGVSPDKLTILSRNEKEIPISGSNGVAGKLLASDSVLEKMKKLKAVALEAQASIANDAVKPENHQIYVNSSKTCVKYLKEIYYSRSLPVRIFMRIFEIIALRSMFVAIKNIAKEFLESQKKLQSTPPPVIEKRKSIELLKPDDTIFAQRVYPEEELQISLGDEIEDPIIDDDEEEETLAIDEPETPVVEEEEKENIETSYRRNRKGITLSGSGSNPLTTSSHREEMFPG